MTLLARAGLASVVVHVVVTVALASVTPRPLPVRAAPIEVELTFRPPLARRTTTAPPPPPKRTRPVMPAGGRRAASPTKASAPLPVVVDAALAESSGPRGPPSWGPPDAGAAGPSDDAVAAAPALVLPPTEPVLLGLPRVDYPPNALLNEIEGVVRLDVVLGADGVVREVNVLEAPSGELAEAARAALRAARFRAATRDGQPVEARFSYRYRFELR